MKMYGLIGAVLGLSFGVASAADLPSPSGWKTRSFSGETQYRDAGRAYCGRAEGTASARYLEQEIDLTKTPIIEWSWLSEQQINVANQKVKQGDDFTARVYLVFDVGFTGLTAKSLNYVWTHQVPLGQSWSSPYTDSVKMISVTNNQSTPAGQWQSVRRNMRDDLRAAFGYDVDKIDGVAIMVDADNTKGVADSCFSGLSVSAG